MPLDIATQRIREEVRRNVTDQLAQATASWKDQKLVDIETTEAIANRLQSWAKLFGFFVAIPLLLIAAWLGLLGYKSYTDFLTSVTVAKNDVDNKIKSTASQLNSLQLDAGKLSQMQSSIGPELQQAKRDITSAELTARGFSSIQNGLANKQTALESSLNTVQSDLTKKQQQLESDLNSVQSDLTPKISNAESELAKVQEREASLSKELDAAQQNSAAIQQLNSRVNDLQSQIVKFTSSSGLTTDQQQSVTNALTKFRSYLVGLGLDAPSKIPVVQIATEPGRTSMDPAGGQMEIGKDLLDDPGDYLWTYADLIITPLSSGADPYLRFVLEHYLPGSSLNEKPVSYVLQGTDSIQTDWIASLWKIRNSIGQADADQLFVLALKNSQPRGDAAIDEYIKKLLKNTSHQFLGGKYETQIRDILDNGLLQAEHKK